MNHATINAMFPGAVPEYRFCERRWRFDFAWPDKKVALEIGGKIRSDARRRNDVYKYSRAVALGWRVVRVKDANSLADAEAALSAIEVANAP